MNDEIPARAQIEIGAELITAGDWYEEGDTTEYRINVNTHYADLMIMERRTVFEIHDALWNRLLIMLINQLWDDRRNGPEANRAHRGRWGWCNKNGLYDLELVIGLPGLEDYHANFQTVDGGEWDLTVGNDKDGTPADLVTWLKENWLPTQGIKT